MKCLKKSLILIISTASLLSNGCRTTRENKNDNTEGKTEEQKEDKIETKTGGFSNASAPISALTSQSSLDVTRYFPNEDSEWWKSGCKKDKEGYAIGCSKAGCSEWPDYRCQSTTNQEGLNNHTASNPPAALDANKLFPYEDGAAWKSGCSQQTPGIAIGCSLAGCSQWNDFRCHSTKAPLGSPESASYKPAENPSTHTSRNPPEVSKIFPYENTEYWFSGCVKGKTGVTVGCSVQGCREWPDARCHEGTLDKVGEHSLDTPPPMSNTFIGENSVWWKAGCSQDKKGHAIGCSKSGCNQWPDWRCR